MKYIPFELHKLHKQAQISLAASILLLVNFCVVGFLEIADYRDALSSGAARQEETALQGYADHLNGILSEIEQNTSLSLFSAPSSFSEENLHLAREAYQRLEHQTVSPVPLRECGVCTDQPYSRLILLIFCTYCALFSIQIESRSQMWMLLQTRPRSCQIQFAVKAASLSLVVFLFHLALLFENLLIGISLYGLQSLHQPIQQIPGYIDSPVFMSAGTYLMVHFFCSWFWCLGLGFLILALAIRIHHPITCLLIILCTGAVQMGIYQYVSEWSALSVFKYASWASGIFLESFFQSWITVPFLGHAVPAFHIVVCSEALVMILGFAAGLLSWKRYRIIPRRRSLPPRPPVIVNPKGYAWPIFAFEFRKLWISQRALLVLLFLCAVQYRQYAFKTFPPDGIEHYYRQYSASLIGLFTNDTAEKARQLRLSFGISLQEQQALDQALEKGEISESYYRWKTAFQERSNEKETAVSMIESQCRNLMEQKQRGFAVEYVIQTPWDQWFGDKEENLGDFIKLAAALILGLSQIHTYETATHMHTLLYPGPARRSRLMQAKRIQAVIYTAICIGIAYMPRILWTVRTFQVRGYRCHCHSLSVFQWLPFNPPVWLCILLLYTARIAIAYMVVILIWKMGWLPFRKTSHDS